MPDAQDFWVYENWRARGPHARYHRRACAFCQDGKGRGGQSADSPNGRWLGPYTLAHAKQSFTGKTGVTIAPVPCKVCAPDATP